MKMDNFKMTSTAAMPLWITDSRIDPSWIKEKMPMFQDSSECVVQDISNETRKGAKVKDGATLLMQLESPSNENGTTLVAKQVPATGLALSCKLGLAREAMFYNTLAPKIRIPSYNGDDTRAPCIPKIYYSYGDMSDGSKIVVMEDLSAGFVDSGILFGPGNPNNWKRDLKSKIADAFPSAVPTSFEVANQTFLAIASAHASFWRDKELLKEEYNWLRGSSWTSGNDEASWWASQGMIQAMWENYLKNETNEEGIRWDSQVRNIVEKAMKGISWESHRKRLNESTHFTLVHGDFWPGNIMVSKGDSVRDLRILDWEMVGECIPSQLCPIAFGVSSM
jgi:hypothetical protein